MTCLLPGETEQEFWEFPANGTGPGAKSLRKPSGGCTYCFGSRALFVVPLWVSSTDPNVIKGAVRMQLENRHIGDFSVAEGQHFDYFNVAEDGSRTQILATVLAGGPETYGLNGNLGGFEIAPRFFSLKGNAIGLWRENQRWVAAFYRQGNLAYFQALSARDFDEDLISEIECIREWLRGAEFVEKINSVVVWEPMTDPVAVTELGERLQATATVSDRPMPMLPLEETALMPESFALREKSSARQKNWMRLAFLGLFVYMAIMAVVMFGIMMDQRANAAERNWIAQHESEAAIVAETQARWDELQPAINAEGYPLELFYRVAKMLPEEGIRITRFEANGPKILLSGEASSVSAAISWKATLMKSPNFIEYEWEFPAPDIQADNRATFNAEANLKQ